MGLKENAVQNQVLHYLWTKKIFAWRNNNAGIYDPTRKRFRAFTGLPGVSDILGIFDNGRMLAIECKSAKGTVSSAQKEFIEKINSMGGLAFVARSVEDIFKHGL